VFGGVCHLLLFREPDSEDHLVRHGVWADLRLTGYTHGALLRSALLTSARNGRRADGTVSSCEEAHAPCRG
jgi:hypothetical protein